MAVAVTLAAPADPCDGCRTSLQGTGTVLVPAFSVLCADNSTQQCSCSIVIVDIALPGIAAVIPMGPTVVVPLLFLSLVCCLC
jgi:hypothetical protein